MEDEITIFEGYPYKLWDIHRMSLIHCDLYGGNIVLNGSYRTTPLICDLGLSKSVNSSQPTTSTIQGVLPYIAPEVKFTQKVRYLFFWHYYASNCQW